MVVKVRQVIWNRGLLTKEPSLCHGILVNVLYVLSHSLLLFDHHPEVHQFRPDQTCLLATEPRGVREGVLT